MEVNLSPKHFIANFKGMTGDKRLDARRHGLWNSLNMQPGSPISKLSTSGAERFPINGRQVPTCADTFRHQASLKIQSVL